MKRRLSLLEAIAAVAWRSPDAEDEPEVIVSGIFDRIGIPKVTGVQSATGRATEQRAAEVAAAKRQRAEQGRVDRLYISFRKRLFDPGFRPAHDNGESEAAECGKSLNRRVCDKFRENSSCKDFEGCVFEWLAPDGRRARVKTDGMGSDSISELDMSYVE